MPIFDFTCPQCDHRYEDFVSKHDTPSNCPKCGTLATKQLSATAFILKGAGFYSSGTFPKAKDGPKLDKDLLKLSDRDLNIALGLPPDLP